MAQRREREWPRPWDADEPADPTDWVEQSQRLGPDAPWRQRERARERQEYRAHLRRFCTGVGMLGAIVAVHIVAGVLWGGNAVGFVFLGCAALGVLCFAIWAIWTLTE